MTIQEIAWSAYEYDNARANAEYELALWAADQPVLCGRKLHEMTADNIRFQANRKRRCRKCEYALKNGLTPGWEFEK